jgi:hypothetical protein
MAKSSAAVLWNDRELEQRTTEGLARGLAGAKRRPFRIANVHRPVSGPELYRMLDLRRRRAQIRARRALAQTEG